VLALAYEDEHLVVVNKPAGLVVHPAAGNWSGTLMNGLLAHHPAAAGLPRAGIVHRLDKDTSGLMVVGKTLEAVTALTRQIAARE
ncbi:pseudouridine synthase, partial [Proteus mirabilis]|uniref:pseudouridine synthase n=1 Tax=Proteus mirabilis TaxID=584 RepID=UPI001EF805BC